MKNLILKGMTKIEAVIWLIAMCAMDSPDLTVPLVLMTQALLWLCIIGPRIDWRGDLNHEGDTAAPRAGRE